MKGKIGVILYLLICLNVLIPTQFVSSDLTLDWELIQNGDSRAIGVDNENNLLLFYLGADDDLSKTWLIKYSTSGEVVYNDSMEFGYDYFLYTKKWIDGEGKSYLVGRLSESISIYVFDNQLVPCNYLFLNKSDINGNFDTCNLFVTKIGNIYLRITYYISFYNSTHYEKKEHLIKIDSEGNFVWTLNFHTFVKISADLDNCVSEYDQDYCYFSYQNMLYKIKSSNGKIVWKEELPQNIKGIATSMNGIAVVLGEGSNYAPLTLQYISPKGALKWSKTISSDYGYLNLRNLEAKEYSIGLSVSDLGDEGESGIGADKLFIYNLDGEELGDLEWEYDWAYLFNQKFFYLSDNNSVFVHYTDLLPLPDGSTYIRLYSFENSMTSIAIMSNFSIEFIICVIALHKLSKKEKCIRRLNTNLTTV